MYSIIRSAELPPNVGGTVKFEGEPYCSEVSFFLVNAEPGAGPALHRHPYSETWIVRKGTGRFTAGGQTFDAGPGDIGVVTAGTPHKFKNIGTEPLEVICIHAAPRMAQEWLPEK